MAPLQRHFRNTFLTGIFAAIPLAATVFVIWYIESATRQPLRDFLNVNIPFVGVLLALALIYALGLIVNSLLGMWLIRTIDRVLLRVPLLKEVYQAWKHVTITPGGKEGVFAKVVLVPVENARTRAVGFTSGEGIPGDPATCCVFVPAMPNPIAGRLYFVPLADCITLGISVEEAFKFLLSGGNYVPAELGAATRNA
ncbi:MAG TPA: DUF502 domain-containing protein [Tepidisphaeraceae bacterium]|nr:DUF502 domain-containing protein [Tepidisphaeraceae bacterium]